MPTKAGQCTPVAPCHAPCASHLNPTWPRRQPSQHPLSQAPVQPPTGHRLGATRRQGKPPGWQRLCSREFLPPRWPHNGCTGTQHPRLGKTGFLQVYPGAQRCGSCTTSPRRPQKFHGPLNKPPGWQKKPQTGPCKKKKNPLEPPGPPAALSRFWRRAPPTTRAQMAVGPPWRCT